MEAVEKKLTETGERVKGQPNIDQDMVYYWETFWNLSQGRQVGLGVSGLSQLEIQAYWQNFDVEFVDEDEKEEFLYLIMTMDGAYRRALNDKQKS